MTKIIITGGRDYKNRDLFFKVLDRLQPTELVSGDADGADSFTGEWITVRERIDVPYEIYEAEWAEYDKSAGPIRNNKMLSENMDGLVVAFPGGGGTSNCKKRAKELNIPVLEVK